MVDTTAGTVTLLHLGTPCSPRHTFLPGHTLQGVPTPVRCAERREAQGERSAEGRQRTTVARRPSRRWNVSPTAKTTIPRTGSTTETRLGQAYE